MKARTVLPLALLGCLASAPVKVPPPTPATAGPVVGDYVEARTASVFAGACHYNGELVTSGHEAVLAWHVTAGSWHGTDLTGVRAMAAVASDANLGDDAAPRRTELRVDAATPAQAAAFADLIAARCGAKLGVVTTVVRGPVTFRDDASTYAVGAAGFGSLAVHPMPDAACCTQPHLVWYQPLVAVRHRKVGFTESATYDAGTVADAWQRGDENSAFYGSFSL